VLEARCPHGDDKIEYQDLSGSGLLLEVASSGRKTFACRYIDESGCHRQHRIGTYPNIGVALARREAERIQTASVWGMYPEPNRCARVPRRHADVLERARLDVADAFNVSAHHVTIDVSYPSYGMLRSRITQKG
jgi:hypothetical protein